MKNLQQITDEECMKVAEILGSPNHLSPDSQIFQVKEVLNGMHNKVTNIPGMSWYKAFKYIEECGYEIK